MLHLYQLKGTWKVCKVINITALTLAVRPRLEPVPLFLGAGKLTPYPILYSAVLDFSITSVELISSEPECNPRIVAARAPGSFLASRV